MTAVQPNEIHRNPHTGSKIGTGNAYHKLERKVGDYATAGVAVQLTLIRTACVSLRRYQPDQCQPDADAGRARS